MCAGAIINARLRRVIYGTADPKAGSFGSVIDFNSLPYNHKPELTAGVLQGECAGVLSDFFATLRARRNIFMQGQANRVKFSVDGRINSIIFPGPAVQDRT